MSRFERTYDKAWQQLADSLGREPHQEEAEVLEGTLFKEWIEAEKFDDLIRHLHETYERAGGVTDVAVLCVALRKKKDVARIEKLVRGFITMREKLFWSGWTKAQEGHLGYMRDCAKLAAAAMEMQAELFHNYWSLGMEAEMEQTRAAMLKFQSRTRA
ncbi:MAG: hypothetical protein ACKVS7_09020 [Gemmatimonadaceae bacterium]